MPIRLGFVKAGERIPRVGRAELRWVLPGLLGLLGGLVAALLLSRGRAVPGADVHALTSRLAMLQGAEGIRVRLVGAGIVELVGAASDVELPERAVALLSGEPGVRSVINRVWTPQSHG